MSLKKKILAAGLAVCMAAIMVTGMTLAYFTDQDSKTNNFTIGNVDITLSEPAWEKSGEADAADAYPGEPLAKDPQVTNIGANPAFVAIKVDWPVVDGIDTPVSTRYNYVDGYNTNDWTKVRDITNEAGKVVSSIYLYNEYLPTGEATPAVFDQIVISTEFENGHVNADGYDVVVTAYALQAQGIVGPSWGSVTDGLNEAERQTILTTMNTEFEWNQTF